jgi:hypothetical protein
MSSAPTVSPKSSQAFFSSAPGVASRIALAAPLNLLLEGVENQALRLGALAVLHPGLDLFFLGRRERDAEAGERLHALDRILQRAADLDRGALQILAQGGREIDDRFLGAIENRALHVAEPQQVHGDALEDILVVIRRDIAELLGGFLELLAVLPEALPVLAIVALSSSIAWAASVAFLTASRPSATSGSVKASDMPLPTSSISRPTCFASFENFLRVSPAWPMSL